MPIEHVLTTSDKTGVTPLSSAAKSGDTALLDTYFKTLLSEGVSPEELEEIILAPDGYNRTLILHAAAAGYNDTLRFILSTIEPAKRREAILYKDNWQVSCFGYVFDRGSIDTLSYLLAITGPEVFEATSDSSKELDLVEIKPSAIVLLALHLGRKDAIKAFVNSYKTDHEKERFISSLPCDEALKNDLQYKCVWEGESFDF
ncbi:MAG: hypothetical protein Q7V63_09010 [Gammaproteobacteria bacterium]|nr:hypothetical protein [Gammaproteobacteria bacterium]